MLNGLKTKARDLLPASCQVPAKYWYGKLSGALEAEMDILDALVLPQDRVIDVGGNRGVYAYRLWRLGARVEVFEPNPVCLGILKAWAKGKKEVSVHPAALSSGDGEASLHIPVDEAGTEHDASASLENAGFPHARDEKVSLRSLDSYRFEGVTLIKIDVEGHEHSVIEGAAATIASSKPALLVEIEQRHISRPIGEVFEKIRGFGYRGFFIEDGRLKPLESFDASRHQALENFGGGKAAYINNFLFLHRDRLAAGAYGALVGGDACA